MNNNNIIIFKLNEIYKQLLNRNIVQNEFLFYKQQIESKQFSFQKVIQLILQSDEFTKKSLQDLNKIFEALEIDIQTIEQSVIISYLQKLKQGYSLLNLTSDIINEYKKKIHKKKPQISPEDLPEKEIVNMIQTTFQKILERQATNEELLQYKNYNENTLENTLLHTIECSNLIDRKLHKMIESRKILKTFSKS